MVENIKMDKQGRITIPAQIRNLLALTDKNILEIDIQANQIIIRKREIADPEQLEKWFNTVMNTPLSASLNGDEEQGTKWYSEEYVKNKLGI